MTEGPFILGVSMIRFGKYPDRTIRDLTTDAVRGALADAGIDRGEVGSAWFANSGWGMNGGQDCIRGEVALRGVGLEGLPIINVENACAGGATALHGAWMTVRSGEQDVALAVGAEKVFQHDRLKMFATFLGGLEVAALAELMAEGRRLAEQYPPPPGEGAPRPARSGGARTRRRQRPSAGAMLRMLKDLIVIADHYQLDVAGMVRDALANRGKKGSGGDHSPFMDVYAIAARRHMAEHRSTPEQLAIIAAKNHAHGEANPLAQVRRAYTPEEVLADRPVAFPLTRAMCAPIGDGAAAAVVCSDAFARRQGLGRAVAIRASVLVSGTRDAGAGTGAGIGVRAGRKAYEAANVSPEDVDVAEVHDATAFGELHQSEALGFCGEGQGGVLAASGATRIGGRIPLNPSGGLECRGHPIAASGLAQVHELVSQLRGECGARQVGGARIALAQNGGGMLDGEEAAMGVHVLEAPREGG